MRTTLFVNVLLPLPVPGYFTYRVPFDLNESVEAGKRVVVQFGKKKVYTALIHSISEKAPTVETKYILGVLDLHPIANEFQFKLWEWIASYYVCTVGEVMNAALPAALKLASESKIRIVPGVELSEKILSEKEYTLLRALKENGALTISDASRFADLVKIIPLIHNLIEKGYIVTEEEIRDRFTPKTLSFIKLTDAYSSEDKLQQLYDKLEKKAPKQLDLLIEYIQISKIMSNNPVEVSRKELFARIADADSKFKALEKKGVFEEYDKEISRLNYRQATHTAESIQLTSEQQRAMQEITDSFTVKNVTLLHGVTSSGKTEIYIKLIRQMLDEGKQVLYLLPEIALTTQIINRLQKYFGNEVGVYHSKYNENERVEIWQHVAGTGNQSFNVLLGARSAMFLPFKNLGLIIIDEEHDASYKQYDPAPRYNARDTAIFLASMHGAKVLLGSATPAVESFYNASLGKYGLSTLSERFGGLLLPQVKLVNLKDEHRMKTMQSIFSSALIREVEAALEVNEQVILFQNRRGFSLHLDCDNCNWIPHCVQCDVSLVYHKKQNQLRCHYCGYTTRIPEKCPDCGGTHLVMKGFGTEKIEEELSLILPKAKIARMDLDTTRSRFAHQKLIAAFEERKIDILVGTQMVTKGLDFDHVSLVGILNADSLLSYPDFRAFERGFQLMAQVAGRAGRKNKQGKVLIQAFNPSHPILDMVLHHNYEAMYQSQLVERERFNYPPFCRIVQLSVRHVDADLINRAADELAKRLRSLFGKRVLGPEYPTVSRIRNQYLKNILIKFEKGIPLPKAKDEIRNAIIKLNAHPDYKPVRVVIDVDPM
ncbi:MAG: primosomal protein N' [Bacteroidales bacterium]|nr:primosomal protein N' [Bacteroidales bacterium]